MPLENTSMKANSLYLCNLRRGTFSPPRRRVSTHIIVNAPFLAYNIKLCKTKEIT